MRPAQLGEGDGHDGVVEWCGERVACGVEEPLVELGGGARRLDGGELLGGEEVVARAQWAVEVGGPEPDEGQVEILEQGQGPGDVRLRSTAWRSAGSAITPGVRSSTGSAASAWDSCSVARPAWCCSGGGPR